MHNYELYGVIVFLMMELLYIILDTKDDEGMTPYEIAMEENNTEIVEYLDTLQSVSKQIGKYYSVIFSCHPLICLVN